MSGQTTVQRLVCFHWDQTFSPDSMRSAGLRHHSITTNVLGDSSENEMDAKILRGLD